MRIAQGNEGCMIIEEVIAIHAPIEKVWNTFTDLTCWMHWNTVIRNVRSGERCLSSGKEVKCCLYPFLFPITVNLRIEELIHHERIVWTARKKGLYARHEFIFGKRDNSVLVTSREAFDRSAFKGFRRFSSEEKDAGAYHSIFKRSQGRLLKRAGRNIFSIVYNLMKRCFSDQRMVALCRRKR